MWMLTLRYIFLSDPGNQVSMGSYFSNWETFVRLNWDSGRWSCQLNTNWQCKLGDPRQCTIAKEVTKPGGQIWNQCKWLHLVPQFDTIFLFSIVIIIIIMMISQVPQLPWMLVGFPIPGKFIPINRPEKRLDFSKSHVLPNFCPKLPIFLHTSMEFRNSTEEWQDSIMISHRKQGPTKIPLWNPITRAE